MKELGKLSNAEKEVMDVIWQMDLPVTVNELLGVFVNWKNSTLATILARLISKGYIDKSLNGKTNYYTPTLSQEEFIAHETRGLLQELHRGSYKSLFASLVDDNLSKEEIAELRKWFDEKLGGGDE